MRAAALAVILTSACSAPPSPHLDRAALDAAGARAAYRVAVTRTDPTDAARWLGASAELGSPQAMFLLGNAYRAGAGVARSDERALELYRRAAEHELPAALQTLEMAYAHGELGLAPDDDLARRYAMEAEHAIHDPPPAP